MFYIKTIHINPVMSRRGYLLVLEQGSSHWTRRFVVVRRPYLLFYRSARDPIERSIINLATAVVEYSADKQVWSSRNLPKARNRGTSTNFFFARIFSEHHTSSPFQLKHEHYFWRRVRRRRHRAGCTRLTPC